MLLERLLVLGMATRFGGPLSISGALSDEDPTGAAGDSEFEGDDLPEDEDDDSGEDTDVRASGDDDDDEREAPDSDDDDRQATAKRKHRFSDHDAAEDGFRELQTHASRLEAENAQLRQAAGSQQPRREAAPQPAPFEINEAQLAQIGEAVNAEYLKLPKEQQNLASATKIMMKHVADMNVRQARAVAEAQQQETEARQEATRAAKAELTAVGLDPEADWDLMILQRDTLKRTKPGFLESMTPADQFKTLAKQTRDFLRSRGAHTKAEVKQAKDALNREAGGSMSGGSRRSTSRQSADSQDQGDDRQDSMTNDLRDNRAGLRRRSTTQYNLLTRSGSSMSRR